MKFAESALLGAVALQSINLVSGAHFSAQGGARRSQARGIVRRDDTAGVTAIDDLQDLAYYMNITLGGDSYVVQLDTGSSDLWVAGTVKNANNTGAQATVNYVDTSDTGPIMTAAMTWEGYDFVVPDQAFIQVTPSDDNPEFTGLIGLGPNYVSNVYSALNGSTAGDNPLNRIFLQNTTTPNFITVLLGRSDDPYNQYPGDFTVAEVISNYSNITNQPQLDIVHAEYGDQHWSVLLDSDGIIGNDGKAIETTTNVTETKDTTRLTFMFDTGYTYPQVPADVAKAIYSQIPGAELVNLTEGLSWVMPCIQEVNITFMFGGLPFPINPLDATVQRADLNNDSSCMGTFQPIAEGAMSQDIDGIMGMAFLRNAYLLVNFGDFLDGNTTTKAPGYTQLLSTTNAATAHQDFVKVRNNGSLPSTHSNLNAAAATTSSTGGMSSTVKRIVIVASIVGGSAMLLAVGFCCWCFRRRRGGASKGFAGSYRPLDEPAPAAAVDVHAQEKFTPYVPHGEGQYETAWDHRP